MTKRRGKSKKRAAPKVDRPEFEQKVSELKAELDKLTPARRRLLERNLNKGKAG